MFPIAMRLDRFPPHPALRHLVRRVVDFEGSPGVAEATREVPGASLVLLVDLDRGWTVQGERHRSFVGGLYAGPVDVEHPGSFRGVQLDLDPLAARALLGVPAGAIGPATVRLEDVLGGRHERALVDRVAVARDAEARVAEVQQGLLRRLAARRGGGPAPDVLRAWALLRASGGQIRVEHLARELRCSRRHLARRFDAELGTSPKTLARLVRLDAVRADLGRRPLSRIAADHGFAD